MLDAIVSKSKRVVAQLVAHLDWGHVKRGSNPVRQGVFKFFYYQKHREKPYAQGRIMAKRSAATTTDRTRMWDFLGFSNFKLTRRAGRKTALGQKSS